MNEKNENINLNNAQEKENIKYSILFIIIILFVSFFIVKDILPNNKDNKIILMVGETYTIENVESNLTWSSSDNNVATVDSYGNISAKSSGTVTITAYHENVLIHEYTIEILSNNDNVTNISFKNKNISLSINDTYQLQLNIEPKNYDLSKLTWKSNNKDIVTVESGLIKAIKKGTSTITVITHNGLTDTCNVTVTDKTNIEKIEFSKSNKSIYIGEQYQSEIVFTPSNTYSKVTYKSSNEKIAKVSNNGIITGISEGETTITAKVNNLSTKINITVLKNKNKIITINFKSNGADKISSNKETCTVKNNGCKINFPTITRSGYQILGWSTNSESKSADYKIGETITVYNNSTYYAITSKTLTATFNANKATISQITASCNIYNNSTSCKIQTPTISRINYQTLGWGTSRDASSIVTTSGGNIVISSPITYYAITKINADGVESGCTGWMATTDYYYSSANTSSEKNRISVGTAFTIEEVVGDYFKVTIPNVSGYKYIPHKYVMINLSDYIPSMTFEISNSSSSIFVSSGYSLPDVTGTKLYSTGKVYNIRLRKNEYMAPILYAVAKKLLITQNTLLSQGYSIKVYDTYRPHSVSVKIYNSLTNLYNSNSTVKNNIDYSYGASGTKYKWGKGWFLASSVSSHNTGSAIDMTLVYKSNGQEVEMPTAMHELSTKAIKYYSSSASKKPANYSKEMNDAAKIMDNAATSAGLSTLSSEWWHFQDDNANKLIKNKESKGCDFSVTKVYSY